MATRQTINSGAHEANFCGREEGHARHSYDLEMNSESAKRMQAGSRLTPCAAKRALWSSI